MRTYKGTEAVSLTGELTLPTDVPDYTWQYDVDQDFVGTVLLLRTRVLIPDPEVIPDGVQPDSTNPYMMGDKVKHNGKTWESIIDNNVWEPSVYGWSEVEE